MPTIVEAIEQYLASVTAARSPRTARAYRSGMDHFRAALERAKFDPAAADITRLDEGFITSFIKHITTLSPASQALYLTAARGFYQYLAAERLSDPNLPRLQNLVRQRSRKQGRRIPQFPREAIERLIAYAEGLKEIKQDGGDEARQDGQDEGEGAVKDPVDGADDRAPAPQRQSGKARTAAGASGKSDARQSASARPSASARLTTRARGRSDAQRGRLRDLRDRALILFLADTGLRISEACALTLGDVDFHEGRLMVIGKGDQQALVRISRRALDALQDYLAERRAAGLAGGQKAKSQPLFTRHDRGSAKHADLRPLDSSSAWDVIKARARLAGGDAADQIHPHSFRHYFVTVVLLATNNMEKTRRMARHKSITVTQRYAEIDPELDQDYYEIFNG